MPVRGRQAAMVFQRATGRYHTVRSPMEGFVSAEAMRTQLRLPHSEIRSRETAGDDAVIDLRKLVDDFERMVGRDYATATAREIVAHLVDEGTRIARDYAPVDTGELQQSIEGDVDPKRVYGEIRAEAEHAPFLEYGTGSRGEYPGTSYEIRPNAARALRFEVQGETLYRTKVVHPGIAPQPYMRPAALDLADDLEEYMVRGMVSLIVNTPAAHEAEASARQMLQERDEL